MEENELEMPGLIIVNMRRTAHLDRLITALKSTVKEAGARYLISEATPVMPKGS